MKIFEHPLWQVGFRPMFILATLAGMLLPILWISIFMGYLPAPSATLSSVQWHAHEMFFGFGWAVLGGFLLTSTKNWVGSRGFHGWSLIFLAAAWGFERIGMAFGGQWPIPLFFISNFLFLSAVISMILWTLIRYSQGGSYRLNIYFIVTLPIFLVSKYLILEGMHFRLGTSMTLGLFRVAFLIMLERTLTQFMKGAFQAAILRNAKLDSAIRFLAFALVFEGLLPSNISAWLMLGLALLLSYRFIFWKLLLAIKRMDIGISYLGYLAINLQLLVESLTRIFQLQWTGAFSIHVFTLGALGFIAPAMILRVTKGHTGHPVAFDSIDKGTLWLMIAAFIFRLIGPQLLPAAYSEWTIAAALCWFSAFLIIACRYIPWMLRKRVDGKIH